MFKSRSVGPCLNAAICATALVIVSLSPLTPPGLAQDADTEAQTAPSDVEPVTPPLRFFDSPQETPDGDAFVPELAEATAFIRVGEAREQFGVPGSFTLDGSGLTVAVLDTGLRATHHDFAGRVVAQKNFTSDNGGAPDDATDGNGHGTNVGGIIVAGGIHTGVAPAAGIVPIKVLSNSGGGSFAAIRDALKWVRDHRQEHSITVVNMSLGDSGNYTSDDFGSDELRELIMELRNQDIAVVVSAGNSFFGHGSEQGMGYPGIFRETISVGAVYDADEGGFGYQDGASTRSSEAGQITPFSQRLHESVAAETRTDIFAPGAPITASGHTTDQGVSTQHGTSQAAPMTAGLVLLMQQYHKHCTGELPSIDDLERWLREGGVEINDDYGDTDNVQNTGLEFRHIDAVDALNAVKASIDGTGK